jgi:hypothetical protein
VVIASSLTGNLLVLFLIALRIEYFLQVVEILSVLPQKEDHPPRQSVAATTATSATAPQSRLASDPESIDLSSPRLRTIIPLAADQRSIFGLDLWPGSLRIWPTTAKSIILGPPEHN